MERHLIAYALILALAAIVIVAIVRRRGNSRDEIERRGRLRDIEAYHQRMAAKKARKPPAPGG